MSTGDHEQGGTLDGGRYAVRRLIGRGGMGDVFLAWDTRLERDVAVKQLRPEFVTDPDVLARFDREAHALARVSHPGVIHVYDRFTGPDGSRFIVLQYVPGESLDALLRREGALPWSRCAGIGVQVCGALEAAHRAGVIHRDVKPGNVLLDEAGDAHVADFGVARLGDAGVTRTNLVVGTAGYIAPEAASGGAITPAVDEYGLAATLFEAYCGVPPYAAEGGPPGLALVRHVTAPVPDPTHHRPDVPPAVRAFLMRGMAKVPDERFGGAAAMGRALEATLTHPAPPRRAAPPPAREYGEPTLVRAVPAPTAVAPADEPHRRSRRWPAVAGALVAAAVAAALVFVLMNGRSAGDPAPGTTAVTAAPTTPMAPQPTADTFDTTPVAPPATMDTSPTAPAEPTTPTEPATGPTPSVPPPSPTADVPTVDEARALTDEAAGDIDDGDYDAAIDKSERALNALEGTGDPYEANALYNLGYAIYLRGDCAGSVPYLERAADHPEGDDGQRQERKATLERARSCAQ
ncbi:MAG: serine/threonine protein kinase [Thermoleophilia bacterium]|nr:serine/threonine protein kinase [Thermoleophilia bacterium]